MGQAFTSGAHGDHDNAQKWSDRAEFFRTDADKANLQETITNDLLESVVHQAQKFSAHHFDEDPQAAIEQALNLMAHPQDINGETVTVQRVMDHLGIDCEEPELAEALTV